MIRARFWHLFGQHTPDPDTIYVDPKDNTHHAACIVCAKDLTGHDPWE